MKKEKLLKIPQEIAERQKVVPLGLQAGQLVVAVLDPTNIQRMDYISTELNGYVKKILDDMDMESPDGRYMFAHGGETVSLLIKR